MKRAAFVLLCFLTACGDADAVAGLAGTYDLDRVAMVEAIVKDLGLDRELAERQANATRVQLTCEADGAFVLTRQVPEQDAESLTGTWTQSGARFRLETTHRGGTPLSVAQIVEGDVKARSLHLRPGGAGPAAYALTLRRR